MTWHSAGDAGACTTRGMILDLQRFCIHDGPGIRTTVFVKGCPLHCRWCHNPESQGRRQEVVVRQERCIACQSCEAACREGAIRSAGGAPSLDRGACTLCGACTDVCYAQALEIVGREMTVAEVVEQIERDVPFFDESGGGVTFSGGEPLSQPAFLSALLQVCKERDLHTAVETCGFAPWDVFDTIRQHVNLFMYDLKLLDDARHREYTGVSNAQILSNLRRLSTLDHDIVVRLPLVPGVNDAAQHVHELARFVAGLPRISRVDVLPYHPMATDKYGRLDRAYDLPTTRPPSEERLAEVRQILIEHGLKAKVGG